MQRVAIVSGALGLGTVLVFGAAALAAALFPNGSTVPASWNGGGVWDRPMPMPAIEPGVIVDDGKGGGFVKNDSGELRVAPRP